jgi:iron complex transport system ATP-binding protein
MKVTVDHLDAHRGGRRIVNDVSLTVPSGTVLGLLGPNGSGKSTLLRAIAGIDTPAAGTVHFDETEVTTLSRRQIAQRLAVMTQEHSEEFEIPVLELVLLGRIPHGKGFGRDSDADIALAQQSLAQVGASHLIERPFAALSGGERQRVLFARALTQDTPVLILDEPTNHLDIAHQLELLDLIRGTHRTVLIALHDLNLAARSCDAIGVLAHGELIAHGRPDEVLTTTLIRSVFNVESTEVEHPRTGHAHFLFDSRSALATARPADQPEPIQEGTTR